MVNKIHQFRVPVDSELNDYLDELSQSNARNKSETIRVALQFAMLVEKDRIAEAVALYGKLALAWHAPQPVAPPAPTSQKKMKPLQVDNDDLPAVVVKKSSDSDGGKSATNFLNSLQALAGGM